MGRPAKKSSEKMQEIADKINEMKRQMYPLVEEVIRELSNQKHGHIAGNVTAQDLAVEFKRMEIEPNLAKELARSAYTQHERFRFSEEGKKIQGIL